MSMTKSEKKHDENLKNHRSMMKSDGETILSSFEYACCHFH